MIIYVEKPWNFTNKSIRIKEFGKAAGYKINKQKPVAFLYKVN